MIRGQIIKCCGCGNELELNEDNFYFFPSANRFKTPCKECQKARAKRMNPEKVKRAKERRKTDEEYYARVRKTWNAANKRNAPKKYKSVLRWKKGQREKMTDYYARELIYHAHKIPIQKFKDNKDLINLKVQTIKFHRLIKQKQSS